MMHPSFMLSHVRSRRSCTAGVSAKPIHAYVHKLKERKIAACSTTSRKQPAATRLINKRRFVQVAAATATAAATTHLLGSATSPVAILSAVMASSSPCNAVRYILQTTHGSTKTSKVPSRVPCILLVFQLHFTSPTLLLLLLLLLPHSPACDCDPAAAAPRPP